MKCLPSQIQVKWGEGFKSVKRVLFYAASLLHLTTNTFSLTVWSTRASPNLSLSLLHASTQCIQILCKKGSKHHTTKEIPIALAELKCHEQLPHFRLVRDDSRWIPTLHVYLHLEAVLPTHLQGSHFPKEIFQGMQFALVWSVSPWVRTGALPSTQTAAESLAIQPHHVINYLDYLRSSLRCSLPQILAIYWQDSVIPTQFSIFGCQTSL